MELERSPGEEAGLPFPEPPPPARFAPERYAAYLQEFGRCNDCGLRAGATQGVPGEGSLDAPLMLVGESPGYEEDRQGRPFVGPAGRLLDRSLARLGVPRSRVYITNVLKYRPPGNRLPHVGELRACAGHLRREIEILRPKVIGAMGAIAVLGVLRVKKPMKEVRGRRLEVDRIVVYPLYHPAFALRNLDRDPRILEVFQSDLRRACIEAGLIAGPSP